MSDGISATGKNESYRKHGFKLKITRSPGLLMTDRNCDKSYEMIGGVALAGSESQWP